MLPCYHSIADPLSSIITLTVTNSVTISRKTVDDSGDSGAVSGDKVLGDSKILE